MRVATFNILHGRTVGDGVHPQRLEDCVRRLDPDILALQEVDCDQPRSSLADLTAVAAKAMGAVAHRFVAAISGTPGATWMAATGLEQPGTAAYGIALLSRFPVASWQVVRLPRIPMRFPMYLPGPNRVMIVDEEPRAAVIAQMHTPLGLLTVANTHLSFVPGWNRRQLRRLVHDMRGFPTPRMLLGDLNMTPATVHRWSGMRPLAVADTFPADAPGRQLDHILTDDDRLRGGVTESELTPISDHRPLVVDLTGG
ncbi:Metal-dependent hydrolase, endonuclease/exonuclease/phosphatase family [Mycobacterium rhizamassiliense]|jgi:endonuclease/exonuclease/phosphatase family metal-dependent hydrolase|uniref:Metal-dependent hydrolase, endonuclease/exonuclease/phosphatase family n=1 Tax=Mycobacterium rhizamassiliense TaxID=1841860 RepID=A0A2U3NLR2_9MYCO|nr:endonuclease/exonuclease/phosphatase family protein [Mycobacterium rhizamassiliense]SPM32440.1 Metal-dependent hydrolase, endonuclease/exonuclease/phosphatase family [Mycobacterium rhizamassiliense]